jgi:hypothetical protein
MQKMKKGNAGAIVIVVMLILVLGGVTAYLLLNKTAPEPIVPMIELIIPTSLDSDTGQPIESFAILEDLNQTIRKDGKIPLDSAISFKIPQSQTYQIHLQSSGYYTTTAYVSVGNTEVQVMANQTLYPFCKNVTIKQIQEFKVGENTADFSLKCNGGWLRRTSVCLAWSPSFIYADINPREVLCSGFWKQQPNGFYNCDYEGQAATNINCNSLKNTNYTCVMGNMVKPERLKNLVDFCSNFEETIADGQELNFTLNYKLLENPQASDYIRFIVVDKDVVLNNNNKWDITNTNPISGLDVGYADQYKEMAYQTQEMLEWTGQNE